MGLGHRSNRKGSKRASVSDVRCERMQFRGAGARLNPYEEASGRIASRICLSNADAGSLAGTGVSPGASYFTVRHLATADHVA